MSSVEARSIKRERVITLLEQGLILQTEAAELAGVTRQRVHQWVRAERLHPTMARKRHLRELMKQHNGHPRDDGGE